MRAPKELAGYFPHKTKGDCDWNGKAAQMAVDFFPRYLRHIKGKLAGQPYELNPWEKKVVATLFGWRRPDGTRRYREAFVAVPRKNNKTTLCAGLALYMLTCDGEEGPEVYCAACDQPQATMVFDPAAAMVHKNKSLLRRLKVLAAVKRIVYQERNGFMRAIPADAAGSHGFNASCVVLDEVHTQPNRDLYDVLKTSTAARRQPLIVGITTAGHDKTSICYELWEYARQVRDGIVEDTHFLPVLYETREGDDWKDRRVWKRVNPNYGRSVSKEYLEEAFVRACRTPAFENTFKNLHLNMWTESDSRWIGSGDWDACQCDEPADLDEWSLYVGLDLGSTDDLTAMAKLYHKDDRYYLKLQFYCPEATVEGSRKRYHSQYKQWIRDGLITVTPGAATDYAFVRKDVERLHDSRLLMVAFDEWQMRDTQQWMDNEGIPNLKVPQTMSGLWPGVKAVEEAVLNKTLGHDGNPVMRWMLDSTVVDTDANGNRKPNKRKSCGEHGTKGKIDGVPALVMAMGEASVTEQTSVPQIF